MHVLVAVLRAQLPHRATMAADDPGVVEVGRMYAYYKKYGPGRATYIEAWWNVVNWNEVSRRYLEAL